MNDQREDINSQSRQNQYGLIAAGVLLLIVGLGITLFGLGFTILVGPFSLIAILPGLILASVVPFALLKKVKVKQNKAIPSLIFLCLTCAAFWVVFILSFGFVDNMLRGQVGGGGPGYILYPVFLAPALFAGLLTILTFRLIYLTQSES